MILLDERTADGSRHFARWPRAVTWAALCDHLRLLPDVEVVNLIGPHLDAAWLDFTFRGHRFAIHNHGSQFHFSVWDPQCSDMILYRVGRHFERLLGEVAKDQAA
jgi:hypothetical protein